VLPPRFLVNVASKGLRPSVGDLESTATETLWTLILRELGEPRLVSKIQTLSSEKDQTLVTLGCSFELDQKILGASPRVTVPWAEVLGLLPA
jgi:hypothetical protein